MDKTERVVSALDSFLKTHLPDTSVGAIDDIVLNYLVGILEDLGNEDSFDVEDFVEMMEAYIPGFGDITSGTICRWIFQLSEEVASSSSTKEETRETPETPTMTDDTDPSKSLGVLDDIELPYMLTPVSGMRRQDNGTIDSRHWDWTATQGSNSSSARSPRTSDDNMRLLSEMFPDSSKVKVKRCLSDSHGDVEQAIQAMLNPDEQKTRGGSLRAVNKSELYEAGASTVTDENIQLLLEMFPDSCEVQARQCLSIAKGDLEQASQVMLNLQELGELEDQGNSLPGPLPSLHKSSEKNEKHQKESLLQKYGYIDTDDDRKSHKPMEPKKEKKKMVRYINSQMVTTKGERFIQEKKPESEEMKKTYTNLKPARRYHFH